VAAHQGREVLVGKRSHVVPAIDQRRDALGDAVSAGAAEVSVDLEPRAIVVLENGLHVVADDVVAKIRRDVADPEPPAWMRDVAERGRRRKKRLLEASREFAMPRVDVGRRETCRTHHEKQQVLKRDHRIAVMQDGELVMSQRVAVARLVAKKRRPAGCARRRRGDRRPGPARRSARPRQARWRGNGSRREPSGRPGRRAAPADIWRARPLLMRDRPAGRRRCRG